MKKKALFKLPKTGLKGTAECRDFQWEMDEPQDLGGTDQAATPMEYAYSALAGCIAITLRLYADRKQWDTGEILVKVYKVENENGEDELRKKIEFGNKELTDRQRERMYTISDNCPVSKLFTQEQKIVLEQDEIK